MNAIQVKRKIGEERARLLTRQNNGILILAASAKPAKHFDFPGSFLHLCVPVDLDRATNLYLI